MKEYIPIPPDKAYRFLNTGCLIIVSSLDQNNQPNLTPIAWNCPVDYGDTTRLLFVCSKEHKTYSNVTKTQKFAILIPHASQAKMVSMLGKISGHEKDKIKELKLEVAPTEKFGCAVLPDVIAYMECELYREVDEGEVAVLFARVVTAMADKEAFDKRLLSESPAGKTLHHLGNKIFITTANNIENC